VETRRPLEIRMLGPLRIGRNGATVVLPASRKVRALFAYLALAPQAVPRERLCELFWDVPNDPRGELRWCLSKLRAALDEPAVRRIDAHGDAVRLDLTDCAFDARDVVLATPSAERLERAELQRLVDRFDGDFLEGLALDNSPAFTAWLTAQRRRFRGYHVALLERLVERAAPEDVLSTLERWAQLAPFDQRVHELLLAELARCNRLREAEEHLSATVRLLEVEGLDGAHLRDAWRSARGKLQPIATDADAPSSGLTRRASVVVMPFVDASAVIAARGGPADALAHDVITRLAKLRSLFVIAQGTAFVLDERRIAPAHAGRMLNVDYVVSGSVSRRECRLHVSVELAETRSARIVWAEEYDRTVDDAFAVLDDIGDSIVASVAGEIEASERNRAILRPPNSLDAWEAHHRGLWHMYRFNEADNQRARHFFEQATVLDPTFARAYAGLSFTYFQDAFQGWALREPAIVRAYETAGQSLMADERDPAAHWAAGRALWLRGRFEDAVAALEKAVDLSPNFALGHYTLAFVHSQAGDPQAAISSSDHARHLSPFDPLLFGMLGARAMALARLGRFDEAADFGTKAAARPNAHPHIGAIAALSLALAGRLDEARAHVATIRESLPGYRVGDFLTAMQFAPDDQGLFREAASRIGLSE